MALSKLYQETDRPEDPINFIRREISSEFPEIDEIQSMKEQIESLKAEKTKAEVEDSTKQIVKKKTNKEIQKLLLEKFDKFVKLADDTNPSLLKRHLTKKLLDKLMKKKTKFNANLLDNIQSGLAIYNQEVGVFASDQDAYVKFAMLFDLVLIDLHPSTEISETKDENEDENGNNSESTSDELTDMDPENKFIKSISIKISRNINATPFMSIATPEQMTSIAEKVKTIVIKLEDEDFEGKYYDYIDIDDEKKLKWIEEGILFEKNAENETLKAADTYRYWPHARSIFINDKNNIKVWVNEEEHFQVVSYEIGGNLKSVYDRLNQMMDHFKELEFAQHEKWGFLSHNLKNIGHTMRISVKIEISQLLRDENKEKWEKLTEDLLVEKINVVDEIVKLTNKKVFGISEIETARNFQKSINDIIAAENCLFVAA